MNKKVCWMCKVRVQILQVRLVRVRERRASGGGRRDGTMSTTKMKRYISRRYIIGNTGRGRGRDEERAQILHVSFVCERERRTENVDGAAIKLYDNMSLCTVLFGKRTFLSST